MTTRDRVAAECLVLLNTDPDVSDVYAEEAADRIDAIYAEDRRQWESAARDCGEQCRQLQAKVAEDRLVWDEERKTLGEGIDYWRKRAEKADEQNEWYGKRCQWYQGEISKAEAREAALLADRDSWKEANVRASQSCAEYAAEAEHLRDKIDDAFESGYIQGHNDTVESKYREPADAAEDYRLAIITHAAPKAEEWRGPVRCNKCSKVYPTAPSAHYWSWNKHPYPRELCDGTFVPYERRKGGARCHRRKQIGRYGDGEGASRSRGEGGEVMSKRDDGGRPMTAAEARVIAASIAERKAWAHKPFYSADDEDYDAWCRASEELVAAGDALVKARGIKV